MLDFELNPVETRVLGALLEKDLATPEYYPLSLNALTNACNQKSNREPVVSYDDGIVRAAIDSLRLKHLAFIRSGDGRVQKYGHDMTEYFNLGRRELAILTVLLLRGPQTLNELRERTQRMHSFDDIEEVERCLARLAEWQPGPLASKLSRQPGTKEPRYAQLLSGEPSIEPVIAPPPPVRVTADNERVARLEIEVESLRAQVADLVRQFSDFRRQFE